MIFDLSIGKSKFMLTFFIFSDKMLSAFEKSAFRCDFSAKGKENVCSKL